MASVDLEWNANPSEDSVLRYEIERRPIRASQHDSRWRRGAYNITRNFMGGFRRVGEVPGSQTIFNDGGRMLARRFFRPTYTHNSEILPYQSYEYRIRAVSNRGRRGPWVYTIVDPPESTSTDGFIRGRVVTGEDRGGVAHVAHIGLPLPIASDRLAEDVYNYGSHPIGVSTQIEALVAGNPIGAHTYSAPDGRFTLQIPAAHLGDAIVLRARATGYWQEGTSSQGHPPSITIPASRHYEYAIVPMMPTGTAPPGGPGSITVRVVGSTDDAAGNRIVHKIDEPLPIVDAARAQFVYDNTTRGVGLRDHIVELFDGTTSVANAITDDQGKWTFSVDATHFGRPLSIRSSRYAGWQDGIHQDGWPASLPIVLTAARPAFEHAIIPKFKPARSPPREATVILQAHGPVHRSNALTPPHGGRAAVLGPSQTDSLNFDCETKGRVGQRTFRLFFIDALRGSKMSLRELQTAGLDTAYLSVDFSSGPVTSRFTGDELEIPLPMPTGNRRITIQLQSNPTVTRRAISAVLLVYNHNAGPYDPRLDDIAIRNIRGVGGSEAQLRANHVLDVNYLGIVVLP